MLNVLSFARARAFWSIGLAISFLFAGLVGSGARAGNTDNATDNAAVPQNFTLNVTLAAIWEGEPPSPVNREALARFRQEFSSTKMIHFISPAYFSRGARDSRTRESDRLKLLDLVGKDDIAGIYLNGWKSIIEAAGVSFRNNPTFWGNKLSPRQCLDDCGREVAITAYPPADLRKIIRKSRALFAKNGFGSGTIMQVAGHAAGPDVRGAASAEGITHDFSALAVATLSARLYRFPLANQLNELWGGVGPLMRPFELQTGDGTITQMTANGVHVEFMSEEEITACIDALLGPPAAATRHLYIGVPMETFAISLPKLEYTIQELFKRSSDGKFPLAWTAEVLPAANANRPQFSSAKPPQGDAH